MKEAKKVNETAETRKVVEGVLDINKSAYTMYNDKLKNGMRRLKFVFEPDNSMDFDTRWNRATELDCKCAQSEIRAAIVHGCVEKGISATACYQMLCSGERGAYDALIVHYTPKKK